MTASLKIFSYARCSTCRKALAWLNLQNIKYKLFDIIDSPPSKEMISDAINQLGDRKYLFNTSGKIYRSIGASAIKIMNDENVVDLLNSEGGLIKRPFVMHPNGRFLIGFNQSIWEDFFLNQD
ncbi:MULTISPECIES: arsenate reductase family protein [Prochlorococcus]|uniref:Arsenate reductase related protein n=1 Tax=Prochlorococcus marinus (strain SARG / CCMP1375 / SS120) TaxID=167539 RepID=Q7VD72_PROMA|nr:MULTISPECIES: arsenate reductase family protein [Prochlorococcus]AAP99556.1 Arsenate reductase related protein [Prochlorococcus marinus subsp. marinus str. CCMP1375]KGG11170.1 putative arsenate reductase [Prochlorococcus marinus str. LG]KGG21508.1 putative arsenate reductase [Prochlorococcus marinus str. SS2]KGG23147.1 putative arsenate reductase [Prochlorococcus marinus str. SS35]KGG33858.1 putative arsenate reductase [Prochlorococcus marinus str. SS51]